MKSLRRKISSKFNLNRKEKESAPRIEEPILEDAAAEAWMSGGHSSAFDIPAQINIYEQYVKPQPRPTGTTPQNRLRRKSTQVLGRPFENGRVRSAGDTMTNISESNAIHEVPPTHRFRPEHVPLLRSQYRTQQVPRAKDIQVEDPTVMRVNTSNAYGFMVDEEDADLQKAYLESLQTAAARTREAGKGMFDGMIPPPRAAPQPEAPTEGFQASSYVRFSDDPTSCIVCTEDFSSTVRPPPWISLACVHEPSICTRCLSECIKSDLETKIWNQIKCPECKELLVFEDIKRLADPVSFARYEAMSVRGAVNGDSDFVSCQKCDSGHFHESGASQPIVECPNCRFRSCFTHNIPWHKGMTCEEYDRMLEDPDGFQTERDRENEALEAERRNLEVFQEARRQQEEEDRRVARELSQQDQLAEQDRQKQRHEEQIRYEERKRRERAQQQRDAERRKQAQEQAQQREEIKRRQREEKASRDIVQRTTKQCPGCRWPIEKNDGCDHMTCQKRAYSSGRMSMIRG
ncbi:hypothetical protein G7Y89_g6245 [Cudoniella acicularis]|uniref:RBR-type E3 ubiquitin transferase n=1 Tax=Cudoniella acicularis TaxID=354080 RepID=A0A8H4RN28_9HELO|nr:hypothetical protein G7Y89_g6245 [Cudoniella acicularis]